MAAAAHLSPAEVAADLAEHSSSSPFDSSFCFAFPVDTTIFRYQIYVFSLTCEKNMFRNIFFVNVPALRIEPATVHTAVDRFAIAASFAVESHTVAQASCADKHPYSLRQTSPALWLLVLNNSVQHWLQLVADIPATT